MLIVDSNVCVCVWMLKLKLTVTKCKKKICALAYPVFWFRPIKFLPSNSYFLLREMLASALYVAFRTCETLVFLENLLGLLFLRASDNKNF